MDAGEEPVILGAAVSRNPVIAGNTNTPAARVLCKSRGYAFHPGIVRKCRSIKTAGIHTKARANAPSQDNGKNRRYGFSRILNRVAISTLVLAQQVGVEHHANVANHKSTLFGHTQRSIREPEHSLIYKFANRFQFSGKIFFKTNVKSLFNCLELQLKARNQLANHGFAQAIILS
jgi:hypothetical protein